jgi:hypothetical protein
VGVRRAWRWDRNCGESWFIADNVKAVDVWFRYSVIGRSLVSDYVPLNEDLIQSCRLTRMKKLAERLIQVSRSLSKVRFFEGSDPFLES